MSTPKHRKAPGTSYFVTTKCWQGRRVFQIREVSDMLETLLGYRERGVYLLHEFVIMPDRIHLLLTPNATTSIEKAVQFIKGGSSHRIGKSRGSKSEIWQVGFHDWTVRDIGDWNAKAEYIHLNPVRAKLVERAEDWPYSSARGRFRLDRVPEKFKLSSAAKAHDQGALALGLKPQPPKEGSVADAAPEGSAAKFLAAKAANA